MKKCSKCNQIKERTDFYNYDKSRDGVGYYCKECHKEITKNNYVKHPRILLSPEQKLKRKREYDKAYNKKCDWSKYYGKRNIYRLKFPEIVLAEQATSKIKPKKGLDKHHWSYNKEHWMDIIFLGKSIHRIAHRNMIYDQERMMFRTTAGILLDSKIDHLNFIDGLNKLE